MSPKRLSQMWLLIPILFILVTGGAITYSLIQVQYSFFDSEVVKLKDKSILDYKYKIRREVGDTIRYIEYQNSQIETDLKRRLKSQTQLGYEIAQNIYNTYHKKESEKAVEKRVLDALEPLIYTKNAPLRVMDYTGFCEMSDQDIIKSKSDVFKNKDFMGRRYIQEEISIAQIRKEEFLENSFVRKNSKNSSQRITHIKDLGFYDLYVSASYYLDDAIKEFEQSMIAYLQRLEHDRDGYFFIIDTSGNVVTHPFMQSGKNILKIKDKKGLEFVKEMINLTEQYNGSFLEYWWSFEDEALGEHLNSVNDIKKISYVRRVDGINWIVGSGFYTNEIAKLIKDEKVSLRENIERQIAAIVDKSLIIVIAIIFVSLIISRILSRSIERFSENATDKVNKLEVDNKYLKEKVANSVSSLKNSIALMQQYVYSSSTDLHGIITYVSDAFCELTGYPRDELIGKTHAILKDSNTPIDFYEEMWMYLKSGRVWQGEIKNIGKDGEAFWTSLAIIPDINENGEHIGYIAMRQDITNEKVIEQKQSQIAGQSRYVAMGEITDMMVSQWSKPLATIAISANQVNIGLSLDNISEDQIKNAMNDINVKALALSNTMKDFRNFFQSSTGEQMISLELLIDNVLEFLSNSFETDNIKVEVENKLTRETKVSKNEMLHTLIRVIKNITHLFDVKNIEDRKIHIQMLEVSNEIIVEITDNSGGFSDEALKMLFSPRVTNSDGMACSLYQSKVLIKEQLKGTLEAINHGDATIMRIVLPV